MSPRTYNMDRRREDAARTRQRLVDAARDLLLESGFRRLGLDEVAKAADVTRATLYNHFGSKLGLVEALLDRAGLSEGAIAPLPEEADPIASVDRVVASWAALWAGDRTTFRRLLALAGADPEAAEVIEQREGWRRAQIAILVGRLMETGRLHQPARALAILTTLTSFATYDQLASDLSHPEAVATLQALAHAGLA